MKIHLGKQIDSERLKRNLDKDKSIASAALFSKAIPKGEMLLQCPICSSAVARDILEIYGFLYRECCECGTALVANPPAEEELRAAYKSDYYTAANKTLLANDQVVGYRIEQIAEPKVTFVKKILQLL
jgi:hypothetical protein